MPVYNVSCWRWCLQLSCLFVVFSPQVNMRNRRVRARNIFQNSSCFDWFSRIFVCWYSFLSLLFMCVKKIYLQSINKSCTSTQIYVLHVSVKLCVSAFLLIRVLLLVVCSIRIYRHISCMLVMVAILLFKESYYWSYVVYVFIDTYRACS